MSFRILDERDIVSLNKNYSNTLIGALEGAIVCANDVSPLAHTIDVSVRSKNLIPNTYIGTFGESRGLTYTDNGDGTIGVSGTVTENFSSVLLTKSLPLEDGVTYYIGKSKNLLFAYQEADGTMRYLKNEVFTWSEEYTFVQLYLQWANGDEVDETIEPMLCIADTPTDYMPYVDVSTVTLTRCKKAIFSKDEYELAKESVAWTSVLIAKIQIAPGNYVASCNFNQVGTDTSTVSMSVRDYTDYTKTLKTIYAYEDETTGKMVAPFTVEEGAEGFQIYLYSNQTENELTTDCIFSNIMVELGTEATDYEAYEGTPYTLSADGTVTIEAVSPTMTLKADKLGVIIECEYVKDANAVIEKLTNAIIALGGTV